MGINGWINKVESMSISDIIENSILDTQDPLIVYQQEQMYHGLDSQGKKIGKYKDLAYAEKKFQQNQLPGFGFKDERLTGDFYRGFAIDVRTNSIVFTSHDPKTPEIIKRDGESIFGLSSPYRSEYSQNELKQAAIKRFKKALYGL